jgi:hypothetical protein
MILGGIKNIALTEEPSVSETS